MGTAPPPHPGTFHGAMVRGLPGSALGGDGGEARDIYGMLPNLLPSMSMAHPWTRAFAELQGGRRAWV